MDRIDIDVEEVGEDKTIEERRQIFNEWPGVFATIKLYLDEAGEVQAVTQFEGPQLQAAGVSKEKAGQCCFAFREVQRVIPKAIFMGQLAGGLMGMLTTGDDNDSENSEQGSGEGRGDGQPTSTDAGVSGDNQGGSVRPVGREEDATDRPSD